ncbi:MAG: DMT family transporter, partial [Kiloniellales bacterium]
LLRDAEERDRDLGLGQRVDGILLMLLAVGIFSIMDAIIKWVTAGYPTIQIVFFRSFFAFVPLSFFVFRRGGGLATRRTFGHVARAVIGLSSMVGFFYAFAYLPLATVVAIGFAAPIFITALSVPLLGEAVGRRRWSAVVVGFLGVVIMVSPGADVFDPVSLVALVATVFYALAAVQVRKLCRTESATAIVFYFSLACSLISGLLLPIYWVTPSWGDLALLISIGLLGGCAQIAMTNAYRRAEAALVASFDYTAIVWSVLLGYFIWDELPRANVWFGVALVIASGAYILYRETTLGLKRGAGRRLHSRR